MANYHRNTLILTAEPFVGFMPVDLYAWVNEHSSDRDIAVALAEVHNHVGILGHDLDEVDDQWLIYTYEAWWEIEKRLYELILASMRRSNQHGETAYNLEQSGLHWRVKPFMEKNGFQDGNGWWIHAETDGVVVMFA